MKFARQDEYYLWDRVDYQALSESLGVKAITVESSSKITAALKKAFNGNGPYVINVLTADRGKMKGAFWTE